MSPRLATFVYLALIWILFRLNRDEEKTSWALWLPVIWLFVACSRSISLWLVCFGLNTAAPAVESADQYLDGSPLDRNFLIFFLLLALIVLIKRGKQVVDVLKSNWGLILFFSYCALSVMWSDYPGLALKRWIKAVGNVVMVIIVLTDPAPIPALKRLFNRVAFILIPLSILFIKYYPEYGRSYNPWTWLPYYSGVTDNKNGLGMLCLISGIGSVWCLTQWFDSEKGPKGKGPFIANCAVLGMAGWLFYMANSMTSLSCFGMATIILIGTHMKAIRARVWMIHAVVVSMICTAVYALFFDSSGGLVENLGRDATLTGRTELWHYVLKMTENPLIGTGYESFWLGPRLEQLWSLFWWHPNEAHNGYLEIYISLGWIGTILNALVLLAAYFGAVAAIRRNSASANLRIAVCVAAIVYNISEAAFKGTDPIWILFFISGVVSLNLGEASLRANESSPLHDLQQLPAIAEQYSGH